MVDKFSDIEFNILDDKVLHELDDSCNKAHERITNSLYNLIFDKAKSGITIGLEGDWGSGKSTIISLLKKKIEDHEKEKYKDEYINRKTVFHVFDSWSHNEDQLRKVFLLSFIEEVKLATNSEEIQKIKEKILGIKNKTVTQTKTISPTAKYIALSAFFIPLGTTLITASKPAELIFLN